MKKVVTFLLAAMALTAVLLMTGCSSRDDDLVGRWVSDDNSAFVTTFNEDGSGTHAISWGWGTTFQWTTPGSDIMWNYSGHPNMRTGYRIDGDVLYITMGDGVIFRYLRD